MDASLPNIVSTFRTATGNFPDATALLHEGQARTYQELEAEVMATASYYVAKGLRKGDKVLVFVPMSMSLYRIVLALLYLGACPVFLDQWVSRSRLQACLKTVPCKGLIAPRKFLWLSWFIGSLRRIPIRLAAGSPGRFASVQVEPVAVAPDDTTLVTFTTGSTGIPKAADRTHAFLQAQLQALSSLLTGMESPCLTTLPIVVLLHLAAGRTTLLPPASFKAARPASYKKLLQLLEDSQTRSIIASPSVVKGLLKLRSGKAFFRISKILTGGGPVFPDLARAIQEGFPNAEIKAVYGSTEAEPISHLAAGALSEVSGEQVLESGLPVGAIDPTATVRILHPDTDSRQVHTAEDLQAACVPTGEAGEVVVSGAHVLRHYIRNPEAQADTKIKIGNTVWHRTGDCGRLDGLGRLYLLGRCKDRFFWDGRWQYPDMLSYWLSEKLHGRAAAVVFFSGEPVVVLEGKKDFQSASFQETLAACGLSGAAITQVPEIPRDPRHHTKTDYAALVQMLQK